MTFQSVLIIAAIALWLYVSITAIDLRKAILAFLSGQPLPPHFEVFPCRVSAHYKQMLYKNDKFYRELSPKHQKTFGSRLMKFLEGKYFDMRDGLRLSTEMEVLIASAAVKITFGLRNFEFERFHTIIIYSDEFYSNASELYVKGETNSSGVIVFSWKDLMYGASIPDDSINLGYHEFAHALFIEYLLDPYESKFKEYYREWLVYISNNDKLEEATQKQIFRDYAAANEMEFFAVALENFFEKPDHFKKELPHLYSLMVEMLNQDLSKK